MSEKCCNGDDSNQKFFIIKWKWFIQDHTTWKLWRRDTHQQGISFHLGLTPEPCEKLLDSIVTWTVLTRALNWPTKSCLVCGQRFRSEWTSCVEGHHCDQRGKNKPAQRGELHAVFLAVTQELNSGKRPYVWLFQWLMGCGQRPGHRVRQDGNGNLAY